MGWLKYVAWRLFTGTLTILGVALILATGGCLTAGLLWASFQLGGFLGPVTLVAAILFFSLAWSVGDE